MNLTPIIDEIADQADDFLEGVVSLDQARAAISEMVTMHHPGFAPTDRLAVIEGVMSVLQEEGFFEWGAVGGDLDDDGVTAEED